MLYTHTKFDFGQLVATKTITAALCFDEIYSALCRHTQCDWGDISLGDKAANDHALTNGGRLLSAYHTAEGKKFWIITEWDRSVTTVLFPEEY